MKDWSEGGLKPQKTTNKALANLIRSYDVSSVIRFGSSPKVHALT